MHVLLNRIISGNWQDKGTILIKTRNAFLYGRSSDVVAMSLLEEPKTFSLIMRNVKSKKDGTFLDLGAHVGSYTVTIAKQGWKVIALEPAPNTFKFLRKNVFLNGLKRVKLINAAIWSKNGTAWLYSSSNQEGDNSLIQKSGSPKVQVKTKTLTSIIEEVGHIDIAKMDVEGAEIEVLSTSDDLMNVDNWVIETAVLKIPSLMELMKEKGYRGHIIETLIRGKSLANVFFYRGSIPKPSRCRA